eukprot:COSAG02_NODE_393_length_23190_cov_56.721926_11_plen_126_part_00
MAVTKRLQMRLLRYYPEVVKEERDMRQNKVMNLIAYFLILIRRLFHASLAGTPLPHRGAIKATVSARHILRAGLAPARTASLVVAVKVLHGRSECRHRKTAIDDYKDCKRELNENELDAVASHCL